MTSRVSMHWCHLLPGSSAMRAAVVLSLCLLCAHAPISSGADDVAASDTSLHARMESLTLALEKLTSDLEEMQRDFEELKEQNIQLRRQATEAERAELRHPLTSSNGSDVRRFVLQPSEMSQTASGGGATYIRWGKTSCPSGSELVYKGYTGGSHSTNEGGASNSLCLAEDPQYLTSVQPRYHAAIWGTEYQTEYQIFPNHNHDVPCVLCRSPTRSSAFMIPGRTSCYPGFQTEYYGYIMAGFWNQDAATEYICVDHYPESKTGGSLGQGGGRLYFTIGRCGSLTCPPYQESRPITCVVCSK